MALALPAFAGVLVGCHHGGTVEVGVSSSGQPLTAVATASDAGSAEAGPATDVDAGLAPGPHLLLTVARVDVHVAGEGDDDDPPGPPPAGAPPEDEGGWVTVFAGSAVVDLLTAGSVETFLGSAPTPAGKVTQIRLILDDARFVDGAISAPVTCPSCTQTGLKIITMGKLVVPNGGVLSVTLDFDKEHSLSSTTDGFRLDPVGKIARVSTR